MTTNYKELEAEFRKRAMIFLGDNNITYRDLGDLLGTSDTHAWQQIRKQTPTTPKVLIHLQRLGMGLSFLMDDEKEFYTPMEIAERMHELGWIDLKAWLTPPREINFRQVLDKIGDRWARVRLKRELAGCPGAPTSTATIFEDALEIYEEHLDSLIEAQ